MACDELPKYNGCKLPAMLIVNTHLSTMPGEHWLAIYITKHKQGFFFDSFGNPPDYDNFPSEINKFLVKNCTNISYSRKQVQSNYATTCGQHCVFFLYHIHKGVPYTTILKMYGPVLECNDCMVCRFVGRIQPVACHGCDFKCVQYNV